MKEVEEGDRRRTRRAFTEEFKASAVRLVLDEGKSVAQVARDLDLSPNAFGMWVRRARADRTRGKTGLTTEERAELARLRKENRELRMERDILKKATVSSVGRRNTWYEVVDGAAGPSGSDGAAKEGTLVSLETRTIAKRHRKSTRKACGLDLRSPRRERWNHPDEGKTQRVGVIPS
jgi:transposase